MKTLEMLSFIFDPAFPWSPLTKTYVSFLLNLFKVPSWNLGYTVFALYFVLVCAVISTAVATSFYVGYRKHAKKYDQPWAIRILRWFVGSLISVLFIPFMLVLLTVLSCDFGSGTLREFPEIGCYSFPNGIFVVMAIVLLVVFTSFTWIMELVFFTPTPNARNVLARPHSRVEFIYLIAKTVFSATSTMFATYIYLRAYLLLLLIGLVFILQLLLLPHFKLKTLYLRTILFGLLTWASIVLIMAVNWPNPPMADLYTVIVILVSPLVVLLVLGLVTSRLAFLNVSWSSIRHYPETWWFRQFWIWRYLLSTDIELGTRFLQFEKFRDNPEMVLFAKDIFDFGSHQFPHSSLLMCSYVTYSEVYSDLPEAMAIHIGKLEAMDASFDVKFLLYRKRRDEEQNAEQDLWERSVSSTLLPILSIKRICGKLENITCRLANSLTISGRCSWMTKSMSVG